MADYLILGQDERDEIVVSFMLSQERDKFCHEINLERYNTMLVNLKEGEWKQRVAQLKADTEKRLAEVDSVIAATKPTMPPAARVTTALARIKAKEAQAKAV